MPWMKKSLRRDTRYRKVIWFWIEVSGYLGITRTRRLGSKNSRISESRCHQILGCSWVVEAGYFKDEWNADSFSLHSQLLQVRRKAERKVERQPCWQKLSFNDTENYCPLILYFHHLYILPITEPPSGNHPSSILHMISIEPTASPSTSLLLAWQKVGTWSRTGPSNWF